MNAAPGAVRRRSFLASTLGLGLASVLGLPLPALAQPSRGGAQPFSRDILVEMARSLAQTPFQDMQVDLPDALRDLGYDGYRDIRYRPDQALWTGEGRGFEAQFFHPGFLFDQPVAVHEVIGDQARRLTFSPDLFSYSGQELAANLDEALNGGPDGAPDGGLGFAGFRLSTPLNRPDVLDEVISFLGASYFRALGRGHQYGKSARGLAINAGLPTGEEFPYFRAFWLERPRDTDGRAGEIVVHALMDSPSITGAYQFTIIPGETTITRVRATLFPRRDIDRLGVAPLTSMYFFGENQTAPSLDFRPEVHDSDALVLDSGMGLRYWRPLVNPARLRLSVFRDTDPQGFGLIQRDRRFASYQDLEAAYERRPSAWVVPEAAWGNGAVLLLEIPTDLEANDNIVAFWVPDENAVPGTPIELAYRVEWRDHAPATGLAEVVGTRVGYGGFAGVQPETDKRKFVVDFAGGPLDYLPADAAVEADLWISRGERTEPVVQHNPHVAPLTGVDADARRGGWRVFFDLTPDAPLVEMRLSLRIDGALLSEVWTYQWTQEPA